MTHRRLDTPRLNAWRRRCAAGAVLALVALTALPGGCTDSASLRTFRQAASNGLKQGLSSILNAILDGAFAVFESGDNANSSTSSSASSATGSSTNDSTTTASP